MAEQVKRNLTLRDATQAFNIVKLVDVTDDRGPIWDARQDLVPIQWLNTSAHAYPYKRRHDPKGKLGWLNFRGRWGNKGDRSCWWHLISPDCQVRICLVGTPLAIPVVANAILFTHRWPTDQGTLSMIDLSHGLSHITNACVLELADQIESFGLHHR